MQHLVSVIMPAYNAGKYVAESIRSVQGQTYAGWELVLVDDGSADDTGEVVRGFADGDARVRYFRQGNGGQASARNTGLRHARGDLVAFLDADDLWLPEKLAAQVKVLDESGADLVFTRGYIFSEGEPPREAEAFGMPAGRVGGAEMFKRLFAANVIANLSVMARRGALDAAGLFDEARTYQNCEDYDMWLTLARRGALFYSMAERLFMYRRHATASTHEESRLLRPMIAVLKKHSAAPGLGRREVELRLRGLYRNLVAALVREGRLAEARACMTEFVEWDRRRFVTRAQEVLLRVWPRRFDFISRECLFRIEWHLDRIAHR